MSVDRAAARLRAALVGDVRTAEPMSRHTTFRVGGPAAVFAVLDGMSDLAAASAVLAEEETPWTVVGQGSNLLVSDAGYDGAVLVLGREFKRHTFEEERLRAGAGCVLAALVQGAFKRGMAGLSWGVGIPGTLGGALVMNAGTRHGSVSGVVESVTVYEPGSGLRLLHDRDIAWGYRSSGLQGRGIIVEGTLRVAQGEPVRIRAEMERYLGERKASQPLGVPSAGSVFVNPEGDSAGRLIEAAGCKGLRVGGASVSEVHANFIVNESGASARDIAALMRRVQATVREAYGIQLEPEIRFLGSFEEA